MKYWHINTHSINNKNHMIKKKLCYIGLGNDYIDYQQRIRKNKMTTPHQFNNFVRYVSIGDIIILYHNCEGHIAYCKYTGKIIEPELTEDFAPDWKRTEIQKHIQVDSWIPIKNPSMKYVQRKTLIELKNNTDKILNSI